MIQIDVDIPTNVRVAAALKGGAEHIFFSEIKDVTVREDRDEFPESIFLFKGNRVIMEIKGFKQVWCSYPLLWSKIESYFGGRYLDTQRFIKSMVEEHFKLKDVTPSDGSELKQSATEKHFKLRDVTPTYKKRGGSIWVEEHFKLRDVAPPRLSQRPTGAVEEHFKLRGVKPLSSIAPISSLVEEHFKLRDVKPVGVYGSTLFQAEEHFKLKDATPH